MLLHTTRLLRINENEDFLNSRFILLGVPFDSTETNIPGQRLAPDEIRKRFIERGLGEKYYNLIYDAGNINAVHGNASKTLETLERSVDEIYELNNNAIPLILGGEHLISLGVYRSLKRRYKEVVFVSFDAHYDLKDEYSGEKLSHSAVSRRIYEIGGKDSVLIHGVRNEDKEEIEFSKNVLVGIDKMNKISGKKIYLSIDLDFFDVSFMPGVSDAEPKGYSLKNFENAINKIDFKNVVAIDIVELNPLIENKISGLNASEVLNMIIKKIIDAKDE